jgi:hypothetical protein
MSGQTSPFGSAVNTGGGQKVTLNPTLQKSFSNLGANLSGITSRLPTANFSYANALKDPKIANAFYKQQLGLLQPGFDEQLRDWNVNFTNRGLPVGSESFAAGMEPIIRGQSLAKQNAANQSTLQALGLAQQEYMMPYQQTGQTLGFLNQMPIPGFPRSSPADFAMQNYQNQSNQYAADNSALGSILGAAASLPFSFGGGSRSSSPGYISGTYDPTLPWLR